MKISILTLVLLGAVTLMIGCADEIITNVEEETPTYADEQSLQKSGHAAGGVRMEFLDCRPTAVGQPGDPICDLQTGLALNDLVGAPPAGPLVVLEPNTNVHQAEWESAPLAAPLILLPGNVTLDLVLVNLGENEPGSNDICWSKHAVLPDGSEIVIVPFHCFENTLPVAGFICPFGGVLGGIPGTPDIPAACLAAAGLQTETVPSSILAPTVLPVGTVIELSIACPDASFLGLFFNRGLDVDGDGVDEFSKITEPAIPEERRMTGGGSFFGNDDNSGPRFTHGFELHCDVAQGPNNLEINWPKAGKGSNSFHLETLVSATCSDDPNIDEAPPHAGFDTYVGSGIGRLNGVSGSTIDFTFTDAGEPGKVADVATIDIDGGTVVVSGTLNRGNHQAHKN